MSLIKPLAPEAVKFIVIHCSATPPDVDVGAEEIGRWHRAKGFFKIGYHFVIRRDGRVEEGRKLTETGAHAEGHNHESIGICLVGGVRKDKDADGKDDADGPRWDLKPENNYTTAQWEALAQLAANMMRTFRAAVVIGHRDFPGVAKACPSFDVAKWRSNIPLL